MKFLDKLLSLLISDKKVKEGVLVEEKVCPNCWGKQEYGGEVREYVRDSTKSNINKDFENQKAFVAQFVETHVTGIRLKSDGDKLVCNGCNKKYVKDTSNKD